MRARGHIIVSAGVSLGCQVTMHSWPATLGCFASGVLIDLDHYLEYWLLRKKFPYRYKDLVDFCWYNEEKKLYLLFHAYEYVFVLWFLIFFSGLRQVWLGLAIGLTIHLVLDQFTNPIKPLFYFLTFRIKNQFDKNKTIAEVYYQRKFKKPE
jgi:hypothetical protein